MNRIINTYAANDVAATAKRLLDGQVARGKRAIDTALDYAATYPKDSYMYKHWMDVADAIRALQSYSVTGKPFTRRPI